MAAGIVDHEAGTRDARRLGGLLWLMPITGTLAMVAAASMAGVPLLNGFLSKEMMLEAARIPTIWAALAGAGAGDAGGAASVAYCVRFVARCSSGPRRDDYPRHPHDPPPGCGCRWRCWWCR